MTQLSSLVVQNPLNVGLVAAVFLAGFLILRFTGAGAGRHPTSLLVPTVGWLLYAAWEWFVAVKSPEANIRVDLLLIWPVLLILSIWFAVKALR